MRAVEKHVLAISELETPCLLLNETIMLRNVARLKSHLNSLGVPLRPHLKTVKSLEAARHLMESASGPATVSTLREAEEFGKAGVMDILYAIGVSPNKLDRVAALRSRGTDLSVIVDSVAAAEAVAAKSREIGTPIPTLIELDCDGHRAGVPAADVHQLVTIGKILYREGAKLRGVLTHAGRSYSGVGGIALESMAEEERASAVACANALRQSELPAPVVSVGSTPTALFARSFAGVTEVRAGVFPFFDLFMVGLGVCEQSDIALSVLTTVIGHRPDKGWIIVDAGWMAMSRDRGTAKQSIDQGYGLACDLFGKPYPDLLIIDAHQEQGILAIRDGGVARPPDLGVGDLVRILPNHACATGAQHDKYFVIGSTPERVHALWPRFRGW
jgi:D-serine deaminase-like pyridoxal phosphate-dependent protein